MSNDNLSFAHWIKFEADRIARLGLLAPEQHRADYIRVQIESALRKAADHFRNGLTDNDPPRAVD